MPRRFRWLYALLRRRRLGVPMFRFGYRLEMLWLRLGPKHLISHMAGPRTTELRNDDQMLALLPSMIDATLRCAQEPAGIENDCINSFGEPWLLPDSIQCPTMVIHDLADPVVCLAHADWAMQCIPHAELCDLHLGGHLIWIGQDTAAMQSRRAEFLHKTTTA